MDLKLENSVTLVIGGVSGIGLACVDAFLSERGKVVIWDVSPDTQQVASRRDNCAGVALDITDATAVSAAAEQASSYFGSINHVVHAAAVGSGKFGAPFTNLTPADWRHVLDVNVSGMVNVAHAMAPILEQQKCGTMVFVASVAGQIGSPTDPPYSASKAANINFAQVMAKDLASSGIRVNTVCPGMVKTPLNRSVWQSWYDRQPVEERLDYEDWAEQKIRQLIPLGTWQQPADVADMIVFLSSERAAQVTGQTINVDGGYVMHW